MTTTTTSLVTMHTRAVELASIACDAPTPGPVALRDATLSPRALAGAVAELLDDALFKGAKFFTAAALRVQATQLLEPRDADLIGRAQHALRGHVHDLWAAGTIVGDDPRMAALVGLYGLWFETAVAARNVRVEVNA